MSQEERPLVLVVCGDHARLNRIRERIRRAGMLPATGRSVLASLSLLSQVQLDGCALVQTVSDGEADQLHAAMQEQRPGCPCFAAREYQHGQLSGWTICPEADLVESLAAALGRPAPPSAADSP